MLACLIVSGILLFLLALLLLPVTVHYSYAAKQEISVRYCGIPVFRSDGKSDKISRKKESSKKQKNQNISPFSLKDHLSQIYKQQGITETVAYIVDLLRFVIEKCDSIAKKFHFSNFRLKLTVASDHPVKTALDYGTVCAALYPLLSFLFQKTECRAKQIDINADFNTNRTEFILSFSVRTNLIVLLIGLLKSTKSFKNIKDVHFNE